MARQWIVSPAGMSVDNPASSGSPEVPAERGAIAMPGPRVVRGAHGLHRGAIAILCVVALAVITVAPSRSGDRDRMRLAAEHLVGAQLSSGLFHYDFDFIVGGPSTSDHMARQAGTAYGLAEYYLHTKHDTVRRAIEAALSKFGALSLPIGKGTVQTALEKIRLLSIPFGRYKLRVMLDRLGLLYEAEGDGKLVSSDDDYGNALAGTTALALLTELHYFRATGDARFAELRAGWLEGLLHLRIPGRGFKESPTSIEESPYFNGETWLALAFYNGTFPEDEATAAMLPDLDDYLMEKYTGVPQIGFYHWGAMAAAVRFATTSDNRFADFAREQARQFLDDLRPEVHPGVNSCYSVEGLSAAAATLRASGHNDTYMINRIGARIRAEMKKNRALQILPGQQRLKLGGGAYLASPRLPVYVGAFLAGVNRPYTRIDYTQHCLAAMIKLERYELK